jgi:adenylate kinase family enzyme
MRRILVTGMSGAGKSSALAELATRGFDVVDTDEPGWTDWSDEEDGYVWREDRISELLARDRQVTLYVSGTVSNQGRFYPRFDAVVLLSAPVDVLLARIETRTANDYGKTPEQRALILGHVAEVEPLLRAACTLEIDAAQPLYVVVAELVRIGSEPSTSSAARERDPADTVPDRPEQRVGDAAEENDEPHDPHLAGMRHERCRAEPDQHPGHDVARVVHAEGDARERDERRRGEEQCAAAS